MDKMITIQELLKNRGLDETKGKILLVRHKQAKRDLYNHYIREREKFLQYQKLQKSNVFKDAKYLVSFIGEDGTLSRFVGVYRVNGVTQLEKELYDPVTNEACHYLYDISEENEMDFAALNERIIIDWGRGALSWCQGFSNLKEVVEIKPGLHYTQFTDYFDVYISYSELQEIVEKSYSDWKRMLSATKGVYLISDTRTGKLYVGSAYGDNGIWGRWSEYAKTGHGGNKRLKENLTENNHDASSFYFSILMTLPRTVTKDEAIKKELFFKRKLGTNSFGLNDN